jgi:endonuclease YncB( thermonuclease family)
MNWFRHRIFLAMLIGIASWAYAQNTHADTYTGKVVSIADGDTVTPSSTVTLASICFF